MAKPRQTSESPAAGTQSEHAEPHDPSLDDELPASVPADEVSDAPHATTESPHDDAAATPPRPAFAAGFPQDPRLNALLVAFEKGNFAKVRSEAPRLAEDTDDEAIRAAALELRSRIEPGKVATLLWCIGAMLMVALYGFYLAKQHG